MHRSCLATFLLTLTLAIASLVSGCAPQNTRPSSSSNSPSTSTPSTSSSGNATSSKKTLTDEEQEICIGAAKASILAGMARDSGVGQKEFASEVDSKIKAADKYKNGTDSSRMMTDTMSNFAINTAYNHPELKKYPLGRFAFSGCKLIFDDQQLSDVDKLVLLVLKKASVTCQNKTSSDDEFDSCLQDELQAEKTRYSE